MGFNPSVGSHSGKIHLFLAGTVLLAGLPCLTGHEVQAASQSQVDRQPAPSELLVIQGRITAIQGTVVTVKLPNGYPGEKGGHAQFVTAGPIFRVDVSHARVLLPDGKQADKLPLVIGDHVLMVLTGPGAGPPEPGQVGPMYSASIVERVLQTDKIITH